jgi:hypothetical protein
MSLGIYVRPPLGLGIMPAAPGPLADQWADRARRAGGIVSDTALQAVRTFLRSAYDAGILPRLHRLNLFAGGNLAACLTPQIRGAGNEYETNVNFIEGNYSEASGLLGTGSQYLKTGFIYTTAGSIAGMTLSVQSGSSNNRTLMGAVGTGTAITLARPISSINISAQVGASPPVVQAVSGNRVWHARRQSSINLKLFRAGAEVAQSIIPSTAAPPPCDVAIYTYNYLGSWTTPIAYRLAGYALDDGTIPDADQPAWATMWATFLATFGRVY